MSTPKIHVSEYQVFSSPPVFNPAVAKSTSTSAQWRIRNCHTARPLLLLLPGAMRSLSSHLVILATPQCHELCNANMQLPYSYLLNRLHYEAQVDKQMTTSRCLKKQTKMRASSLSKEPEEQLLDALDTVGSTEVCLDGYRQNKLYLSSKS